MTIIENLRRRAANFPDDAVVHWSGGSWTTRQLYHRVLGAPDRLTEPGILPGDRVAIHTGNSRGFLSGSNE